MDADRVGVSTMFAGRVPSSAFGGISPECVDKPIHTQRGELSNASSFHILKLRGVEVYWQSGFWPASFKRVKL